MTSTKTNPGNYFEDFKFGQVITHATPAHGDGRRCGALYEPLRHALCGAVVRCLRQGHRLSAIAARRFADLPRGVRQDDAGHLAQRHRQPRLRQLPLPEAGLSRRHARLDVGGDRPQGELQPRDRHRLRALHRAQPERRGRARLCALGDGAQARQGGADAPRRSCRSCRERVDPKDFGAAVPALEHRQPTTSRWPARPTAGATTRWARRSTTSTA